MEVGPASARASASSRLAADPAIGGPSPSDAAKLRKAAQDFEALLVRDVIKTMRQSSAGGRGLLGGAGRNFYQDLIDDELAKALARQGGLGLADVLVRGVTRAASPAKNPSSPPAGRPITSVATTPGHEENAQ